MKTAKEIAQWVIDNRYPKSENDNVSDFEMYHEIISSIKYGFDPKCTCLAFNKSDD